MLDTILGIFTSSGLGAIVGLLGSWLTKREERRTLELKYDFDVKMAELRKSEAEMEFNHELAIADKQIEKTEIEGEIKVEEAELNAFLEGLKEQQQLYKIKFVDAVRGLMRPVITIYLLIIATYITYKINSHVGISAVDKAELLAVFKDTIAQIMFLVTTAIAWWFGSRPSSQRKDH